MSAKASVIIIGAGAAGIAAATKLYENGFTDIKILEAENRIGGRVYSVDFGGSVVDLGGQWVHGEQGNIVYQMVKDMDLLSPSFNTYEDMTFYLSNGSVIDKNLTDRLFKIGHDIWHDEEEAKKYQESFGEYFMKSFQTAVKEKFGSNKDALKVAKLLEEWFQKFFLCMDSAKSWFDVSTNGVFTYTPCEGNQQLNWRDKGYRTILYLLMKKIPDITKQIPLDNKILLNKEVKSIIWENQNGGVTLNCEDGSSYTADHVLVTVSVGVLKKFYRGLFTPDLPPYKVNAIENITLGTVNKILLKFPRKWWPNDLKGFSLVWTEADKNNVKNEISNLDPTYNGISWIDNVFGFYVIDSHPRVLLGWVTGQLAAEVEHLSDEVVIDNCMYLLRKFAGHKYDIPRAEEVLRSKWNSNPHFCGSYTYVSIKQEKANATADDLARPLTSQGKEVVLFAGEATHPTLYSTVHGAIETGYREADRLIKMYKDPEHIGTLIIGAGMAGLGTALKFTELNYEDFLVIEASNHPGGRIKTIYINDKAVDLGAQWIHGKDNALYRIANTHNLLAEEQSREGLGIFVRSDGKVFDEFLVKQVDWEVGKILEECQEFVNTHTFPKSVGEFLNEKFHEYLDSCSDSEDVRTMKLQLFDWHVRFQIIDNSCCSLEELSAKNWGTYVCVDDVAHYNLKRGYQSLIDVITNNIPENKFRFNTPVTRINYNGLSVTVECDATTFICDHVILTPSLGVLKNLPISPLLPYDINASIHEMGFYGIGKIYLFFKEKWWKDLKGIQLLWASDTNLPDNQKWIRHLTGFEEVFNHDNVLLGWTGGHGLKDVEALEDEEVGNICVQVLQMFLPNYKVPMPVKVVRTKWLADPWIKGSYSHISSKCDHNGLGISKLMQPVVVDGVPRILLAGEAMHPSHYSTTHGAFETGQQQAENLFRYLTKNRFVCKI